MPTPPSHRLVATPIPDEQGCAHDCPHPDHVDAPLNVTVPAALEQPLRTWLADMGLTMAHMPTDPDESAGMHAYIVIIHPGSYADRAMRGTL